MRRRCYVLRCEDTLKQDVFFVVPLRLEQSKTVKKLLQGYPQSLRSLNTQKERKRNIIRMHSTISNRRSASVRWNFASLWASSQVSTWTTLTRNTNQSPLDSTTDVSWSLTTKPYIPNSIYTYIYMYNNWFLHEPHHRIVNKPEKVKREAISGPPYIHIFFAFFHIASRQLFGLSSTGKINNSPNKMWTQWVCVIRSFHHHQQRAHN